MKAHGVLQKMLDTCQKKGNVSDEDMREAERQFRILGALWVSDLKEEMAASRSLAKAHSEGGFNISEYW